MSITHVTVRELYAAPGGLRARFHTRFVEPAGERDSAADRLAHVLHATPAAALNGSLLLSEGRVTTVWVQSVEALVAVPGAPVVDPGAQIRVRVRAKANPTSLIVCDDSHTECGREYTKQNDRRFDLFAPGF